MVREYQEKGEILFMDSAIAHVCIHSGRSLVSEYEKKLVMENAITDNHNILSGFYQDFSLSALQPDHHTEPLYTGAGRKGPLCA
jgi:hypothetical protein